MFVDEPPVLDHVEARVLGVLVEKEMATPAHYPLTLAGVVAAANQTTNRDPVTSFGEAEVEKALVRLHDGGLATPVRKPGDRATKYRHKLGEVWEIDPGARAVLAVLLLRGPQTPGELRSRTDRYTSFGSIEEVDGVVDVLEQAGLVERLARIPGQSQRRVRELLSAGQPPEARREETEPVPSPLEERVTALEQRLAELLERLGVEDI